jgi:hypothetical protein
LLKDFFYEMRLDDYAVEPNPLWDWGDYNALGGWTPRAMIDRQVGLSASGEGNRQVTRFVYGQLVQEPRLLVRESISRQAWNAFSNAVKQSLKNLIPYFTCGPQAKAQGAQ